MSTDPAHDYDVGYGRPPKEHRYPKGRSGNPKGRPKKKPQEFPVLLKNALQEKVIVNEQGRRKAVSKSEAIAKQIVNKAAAGDSRLIKLFVELLSKMPEAKCEPIIVFQTVGDELL